MNFRSKAFLGIIIASMLVLSIGIAIQPVSSPIVIPPGTIDPKTIPKYVNTIDSPPPYFVPDQGTTANYTINVIETTQQILPTVNQLGVPTGFTKTTVWAYNGTATFDGTTTFNIANSPAASFEARVGQPIYVRWINNITGPHLFPIDPTLHWADPTNMGMPMGPYPTYPPGFPEAQSVVPLVTHLHGGEVQSYYDGGPDQWFTATGVHGPDYSTLPGIAVDPNSAIYLYPNSQPATTLWYHDHALGITRINVMSGLAGFYLLRDPTGTETRLAPYLPTGKYEVPLAIQDRTFKLTSTVTGTTDFWFDQVGINPTIHPYWMPEFFGNTIMVNGKVWPKMNVDQAVYRFRLLDGSNARFYTITLIDLTTGLKIPFTQIGSDGGYLKAPAVLKELTMAPGERADILVDFNGLGGHQILVKNTAKAPFPGGAQPDPQTVGQIMRFDVSPTPLPSPQGILPLPAGFQLNPALNPTFPTLPTTANKRTLVLWEVMGMLGPLEILLNGQKWDATVSETPTIGTTEDWIIVNPTADTHPIHLHLVQFQLVSRQSIDMPKYTAAWLAAQTDANALPPWTLSYIPNQVDITPYLKGKPVPAAPNEQGWKDTIQVNPGEVTTIRVRFSPIDGTASYQFNATDGPGYVWHCHIIDHEDNEMMRPYVLIN